MTRTNTTNPGRTEAETKLWNALAAQPNSTTAALALAAGIGKSTATKILATWATSGTVTKTRPTKGMAAAWSLPTPPEPKATKDRQVSDGPRLGSGALRGLIVDYLRDNPGAHGPSAIAKVLDRSAGAVNNALEKLVADGYAIKTQQAPKRFAIFTAEGKKAATK